MAFTKSVIFWKNPKKDGSTTTSESKEKDGFLKQAKAGLKRVGNVLEDIKEGVNGAIEAGKDKLREWDLLDASPKEIDTDIWKTLTLNCVLTEGHQFANEVTSYPISTGFIVSDHVIKRNPTFRISGWITDVNMPDSVISLSTIGKVAGSMYSRSGNPLIGSLLGSAGSVLDNMLLDNVSLVKEGFEDIKNLVLDGTTVHVATILGTYENCVIRSASINQDKNTATVLPVDLAFEKINVIGADGKLNSNIGDLELKNALEAVTNSKTGSNLDDMISVLSKQGVNIFATFTG